MFSVNGTLDYFLYSGYAILIMSGIVVVARFVEFAQSRQCPHCKGQIPKSATACKHCGRDVPAVS